ncbi:hypothetical protein BDA99DRAFT_577025 [Phascolomyces articulosus]|uniref:Uncharacterized protein n=1 Tax=Phascolomyces articulosus TaxID=60185 RepID=A0AAD5K007_9FUNG|nr:hypothetical protein BDA99DRAFT_577025 [Phascolomyces articulosus]
MEPPSHGIYSPRPSNANTNPRQLLSQVDTFENELDFLLGECAIITVMLNSLRNVFWARVSRSDSPDVQREILIDYDELDFKIKQLEHKLQLLEMEFRATQRQQQQQQFWFH